MLHIPTWAPSATIKFVSKCNKLHEKDRENHIDLSSYKCINPLLASNQQEVNASRFLGAEAQGEQDFLKETPQFASKLDKSQSNLETFVSGRT